MKKRTRITLWIVIAILIVAGFVWWQLWQLGRGLRTFHAENTQDVLLSAMSAEVLAPNVVGNRQQPAGSEPLLDQYRKNSELSHQRSLLVITWVHASQIFRAVEDWSIHDGKIINSDALTSIPPESRLDGWQTPFCVWVSGQQVVFISSGGNGTLGCGTLRQAAQEAAASLHDARLARNGNLLVTVQRMIK